MSQNGEFDDTNGPQRNYASPYSHNHPVPTVQKYRQHQKELDEEHEQTADAQHDEADDSKAKRAFNSVKAIFKDEDPTESPHDPYPTENRNEEGTGGSGPQGSVQQAGDAQNNGTGAGSSSDAGAVKDSSQRQQGAQKPDAKDGQQKQSATEAVAGHSDPKQKRKDMKRIKRDDGGREVTDPVTHLPIVIHDSTPKDLKQAPENEPTSGEQPRTQTGLSGATKSSSQLNDEQVTLQKDHTGMERMFPPPSFDDAKAELMRTYQLAVSVGIGGVAILATIALVILQLVNAGSWTHGQSQGSGLGVEGKQMFVPSFSTLTIIVTFTFVVGISGGLVWGLQGWLGKKVEEVWEDEVWDAARQQEIQTNNSDAELPESVAWLNSFLASVWPLINPDLFSSIADELEDVMQASLPKIVRMVSVDDLGQGSEALRILGIKWLPTGAASQSVDKDGNLEGADSQQKKSDRTAEGEGQVQGDDDEEKKADKDDKGENQQQKQQKEQEEQAVREGMEAEQGDFVNMELAFAYRARSSGKSIKTRAKNAHLYLKFYFPGGIAVPVWVELRGIIGTMRLRLQLTPDPPFVSLCTLTFLGQPRADLSCVPLSKHSLNLMDLPLISSFVQSAIDAALAEYVAPKSLTLDLKEMLVGDDFKKDTSTRGVVMIFIKQARGFKEGDGGFGPFKGSSDPYVTVSWAKFGKPVSATRIIVDDQAPNWHEWTSILVTAEELNAQEKLRLQLWDSDKFTADDDLGRVEVDLKQLMHSPETRNHMCDREDRFAGQNDDEKMPGTISWSVGYFAKAHITEEQFAKQTEDPNVKTRDDLKKEVSHTAERKLREAVEHDESKELKQQKQQDYKEREDALIIASPPSQEFVSGIFSIQIHNITGLEVESLQKKDDGQDREDGPQQQDDLPTSYCTVILNHTTVYRTRTKPKNAEPFFNAGTERFVKDWRSAEVIVSARDSREGEDDALLGIVYLPLKHIFEKRSQIMESYPLAGGIGYGKARISMVWRSIELKLPKELAGWDYGTLEVKAPVRVKGCLPEDLRGHRIKLRSTLGRMKMYPEDGEWKPKKNKENVFLPVRKRYASAVTVEFRKSTLGPDSTPGFAVFWLKDIPDEEEKTVCLKVWKGGKKNLIKATACCDYQGLEEGEQPLGEIELTLHFWRGLGGYHKHFAGKSKNADVKNVMEVLDTVNDEGMDEDSEDGDGDDDDSEDSEQSSGDEGGNDSTKAKGTKAQIRQKLKPSTNDSSGPVTEDESAGPVEKAKNKVLGLANGHNNEDEGSRGVVAQVKDYKDHHKQLHRQHRGVMQWKGARTLDWMATKVKRGKGKIEDVFEHKERDTGVETEI